MNTKIKLNVEELRREILEGAKAVALATERNEQRSCRGADKIKKVEEEAHPCAGVGEGRELSLEMGMVEAGGWGG